MVQFLVIAQTASFKCVQHCCYFSIQSYADDPAEGLSLTPIPSLDVARCPLAGLQGGAPAQNWIRGQTVQEPRHFLQTGGTSKSGGDRH